MAGKRKHTKRATKAGKRRHAKRAAKSKEQTPDTYGEAVVIELPVEPLDPDAYLKRHIDVQLNRQQAAGLRRVFEGLHRRGIKLANERYVQSPVDVIRYVLEQI